jgi:hypothetical protein
MILLVFYVFNARDINRGKRVNLQPFDPHTPAMFGESISICPSAHPHALSISHGLETWLSLMITASVLVHLRSLKPPCKTGVFANNIVHSLAINDRRLTSATPLSAKFMFCIV